MPLLLDPLTPSLPLPFSRMRLKGEGHGGVEGKGGGIGQGHSVRPEDVAALTYRSQSRHAGSSASLSPRGGAITTKFVFKR